MAVEHPFTFPLPLGLHARPASHLQALASTFASEITLTDRASGRSGNAKSVLAMIAIDVKHGDPCVLHFTGPDESAAHAALAAFLKGKFLEIEDDAAAMAPPPDRHLPLPRSLQAAGLKSFHRGQPVVPGIGIGAVVIATALALPPELQRQKATDPDQEREKFTKAVTELRASVATKVAAAASPQEKSILAAQLSMTTDVALAGKVLEFISAGQTAAQAVMAACDHFAAVLRNADSAYLRERALDIQDVCSRLLQSIHGRALPGQAVVLTKPSICLAESMTPGQFLALDRKFLQGLVLGQAGTTSHTVILARSIGIPTLVSVPDALTMRMPGEEAILDGNLGLLVADLTDPLRHYYQREIHRLAQRAKRRAASAHSPATTADGHRFEVAANISAAAEVAPAAQGGADGVGLFRTEMLFLESQTAPSESDQAAAYAHAAKAAAPNPVIVRLIDLGGDKSAPSINLPEEDNPFLGYRGVRIYQQFADVVKSQLRAVLRASTAGNLKIMIPMISCIEEVQQVKRLLDQARADLAASNIPFAPVPLGVMLEVPSAAFMVKELCEEIDFFSIGSNDLTQYFLAADRTNPAVGHLYHWTHPAFLRLLKQSVDEAHVGQKRITLCGEMGESPSALPLLIGLGLDGISVGPHRIADIKAAVRSARRDRCQQLLAQALACRTRADVEALLAGPAIARDLPLLAPELMATLPGSTKAQVIKDLADLLYLADRVDQPHHLEQAIWEREDTYSTGFGHGFAIPHGKTDYLSANSIAVGRLATPIDWGSTDGQPVDIVILLAIRAQEHQAQHMRVFAQLSRLLMRDEFRDQLRAQQDPGQMLVLLQQSLGLTGS